MFISVLNVLWWSEEHCLQAMIFLKMTFRLALLKWGVCVVLPRAHNKHAGPCAASDARETPCIDDKDSFRKMISAVCANPPSVLHDRSPLRSGETTHISESHSDWRRFYSRDQLHDSKIVQLFVFPNSRSNTHS
jgi:hypothetical protein